MKRFISTSISVLLFTTVSVAANVSSVSVKSNTLPKFDPAYTMIVTTPLNDSGWAMDNRVGLLFDKTGPFDWALASVRFKQTNEELTFTNIFAETYYKLGQNRTWEWGLDNTLQIEDEGVINFDNTFTAKYAKNKLSVKLYPYIYLANMLSAKNQRMNTHTGWLVIANNSSYRGLTFSGRSSADYVDGSFSELLVGPSLDFDITKNASAYIFAGSDFSEANQDILKFRMDATF